MNLSRSEAPSVSVSTSPAAGSARTTHFELFGLPEQQGLDLSRLESARQKLLAVSHPDRFSRGSDTQRRVALQMTARINEAHQTLLNPITRAAYLLSLRGIDVGIETNTRMPPDFLQEQMAWREALEEAREADGVARASALAGLREACAAAYEARLSRLERCIDGGLAQPVDLEQAALEVRALMFIDKFRSELS